jgi:uncharacterized RDD family membrane protein YckC
MTTTFPAAGASVLAGHGRRLAAALLDAVAYAVVVGACGAVGFFAGLAVASGTDTSGDGWEEVGWVLLGAGLGFVIGFVVWVVLTVCLVRRRGARNGQTLGKQIVGIRVVRADRASVGLGLALLREIVTKWVLISVVATLISWLLGFLDGGSIGFLVAAAVWYLPAFADDQRRALHDRMCFTRVVAAGPASAAAVQPATDDLWPVAQ